MNRRPNRQYQVTFLLLLQMIERKGKAKENKMKWI